MLHVYNCILLKMSTWGSKHVEINILWINNNQCIKLVINIQSIHDARSEKHQVTLIMSPAIVCPIGNSMLKIFQIDIIQDRQRTYKHNTEMRTPNTFYPGKDVSITYSECVFVALVIQHATPMPRIILTSVSCLAVSYFSTLSHKRARFSGGGAGGIYLT